MHKIIFITGSAGAGKTTIGRKIAEQYPKSLHIQIDTLRESIVNGIVPPGPFTAEATEQFRLARITAIYMAKLYANHGYDVVLDDICIPEAFADHYTELFPTKAQEHNSFRAYRVLLLPQADVLNQRILARGGPYAQFFVENATPWIYSYLPQMNKAGWIVIDSSNLTIEETAEEVLKRVK